ncbi:MAG TPA: GAF domain-containing sensor histidine kinase [Solirubrobacteraceae bacterium]|jgi:signal transduction histidine kinase|nr:GAF domain-containing sensor histidine kinase [Solirubrobacteraceae bacterium]
MDQDTRGVVTVARSVLEQLDLEVVLDRVLEAARELTGARYAALGVLDATRDRLERFLTLGIDDETRGLIGPLPTGRGVLGELIGTPHALRIGDVGSHRHSYGFPAGHPPMRSFLGVPILIGEEPYGNLYLTEKEAGGEFTEDDEQNATALGAFAAVAIDHARRFAISETQRLELERTVSALDATLQIARALGGQTDMNAVLELVAQRGRALVAARAVVIELLRDDELEMAAGAGELPPGLVGRRVPLERTVASAAVRARRPQRLSDHLNRALFDQHGLGHLGLSAREGLVVPLIFRDRAYGVLVAIDHLEPGEFAAEHERLLTVFAASAAIAVATARSAEDEQRRQRIAAAEAERGRWARELHDETLQSLGNLRLVLAGARRRRDPDDMERAIGRALEQLELDIVSLRSLITDLRPAALDQLGLEPALLALVDRVRADGLDVVARVELAPAPTRLAPELEAGIYRIVQEALTNALKHGAPGEARVEVVEVDGRVRVTVRDDGRGFDPDAPSTGFGLAGMRERVQLLAGRLRIRSAPGAGTTVRVLAPAVHRPPDAGSSPARIPSYGRGGRRAG